MCPTSRVWTDWRRAYRRRVALCGVAAALAGLASANRGLAVEPGVHYLHSTQSPPGAIGNWRLAREGHVGGYYQPVEIRAPEGALISLAVGGGFEEIQPSPRLAGLAVGHVYRFQVSNIPLREGQDVFPTVEIIDRLHPPAGLEARYPIPVQLTQADLELALEGNHVVRVIYVEDPATALPERDDPENQRWFDARPGENALQVADELGRPVAILRIGGRIPDPDGFDEDFFLGSPPFVELVAEETTDTMSLRPSTAKARRRSRSPLPVGVMPATFRPGSRR